MLGKRSDGRQSGVTLIELLIAIAIFAIVLGMGVPSYRNWLQSSQIRTAADSILNGLTLARAEAVKRNQNITFTFTAPANSSSWQVTDANNMVIQQRDYSEGTLHAVVASNPAAPITFNALGRAGGAVTITVTNPTGGLCAAAGGPMRCLNIIVNSGQIRMCDPAVSIAASPRGC